MGAAAWWRRSLGQRFNPAGVAAVAAVAASEPRLALPHVSVQDIRWLDWGELRRAGFRGVVFDKDNTLTAPYAPGLWPPLAAAFDQCRAAFPPGSLAVYSNSADIKKPGGEAKEIESYFGCSASNLVLVGDRYFTDVVYGNRNGFLTVLTEPLNFANESYIVRQVRKFEAYLISYWYRKGHRPIKHPLLPDARRIVKFDPYNDPMAPAA
ncbi:Os01g0796500 [Oryza sativa Japonica Group]|nr:Os01g0796500 [Oryza sativa Japonica Group]|eukprot:NP_001044516.2 Os01g0796500 [Oryza sativa Japonica Group]